MAMDQSLEIPFIGMNIHLPAILVFTMGIGFWPISIWFSVCFLCFAYLFFFGFWGVPLILMPTFLLWLWIKTLVHAVKRSHSYWPTDASSRISLRCSVYQTCTNTSPRMITPLSNWLVMFFFSHGIRPYTSRIFRGPTISTRRPAGITSCVPRAVSLPELAPRQPKFRGRFAWVEKMDVLPLQKWRNTWWIVVDWWTIIMILVW